MENPKIIIPRPAYIAESFKWMLNDLKKVYENKEKKKSLCQSALDDVSNGCIKICSIEKLTKENVVFIDRIGKVNPKENEVYIQNPYISTQYISSECFLENVQKQRYNLYKLLLQKLGAKAITLECFRICLHSATLPFATKRALLLLPARSFWRLSLLLTLLP